MRLLDGDLSLWILSPSGPGQDRARFEVGPGRISFPRLNVFISAGMASESAKPFAAEQQSRWRQAQAAELRGTDPAGAQAAYRSLLAENSILSAGARLALLRISLRRGDLPAAFSWLEEIGKKDRAATTESLVPIWVGAAQLLMDHGNARGRRETRAFMSQALNELAAGRWRLNADQWALYARDLAAALGASAREPVSAREADPAQNALATAAVLDFCVEAYSEIGSLYQSLSGDGAAHPFAATYVRELSVIPVLVSGKDGVTGFMLPPARLLEAAATRLETLTAAENFAGQAALREAGFPGVSSLAAFPFLQITFRERNRIGPLAHLRRYFILYATAALFLVTGVGIFFTVRAVAREVEVSRMKADFVSSVSHEFRTPLSSIEAMLERLESGKVREAEMLQRYYRLSRQEVQRLTRLVNDLLDFARLEEGRAEFAFEAIDLNLAAAEVMESFRNLGFGARLADTPGREDGPLTIRADPGAVRQCIHNLVDNALKYAPDSTPVTLSTGRRGADVYLSVQDQGPGISEDEQALVFEQFYRSRNGSQVIKGTGIGLALVKRIMEAHGGKVSLASRTGAGSTFELIFPGRSE